MVVIYHHFYPAYFLRKNINASKYKEITRNAGIRHKHEDPLEWIMLSIQFPGLDNALVLKQHVALKHKPENDMPHQKLSSKVVFTLESVPMGVLQSSQELAKRFS